MTIETLWTKIEDLNRLTELNNLDRVSFTKKGVEQLIRATYKQAQIDLANELQEQESKSRKDCKGNGCCNEGQEGQKAYRGDTAAFNDIFGRIFKSDK